jgi:membrane-associated phospholipid phosphatase
MLKRVAAFMQIWVLGLAACTAAVIFSFVRLDTPVARYFWNASHPLSPLNEGFGATVLLSVESVAILIVVLMRLTRGRISVFGETLAIACLGSMCAYAFNDHVLKVLFGVPGPAEVIHGARHTLNILMGSANSSFPSGHMVLAGAFSGVFMSLYKGSIWPLAVLLVLAAGLLLAGDWHFLSDIIAGAFLGISAGVLAGTAWAAHSEGR